MKRLALSTLCWAALAAPGMPQTLPFPPSDITLAFDLVDHTGARRTEKDLNGPVLLFFGYANCEAICTVALPVMGEALDELGADGSAITPVMITVDPRFDTPENMAAKLPEHHPRFVGLTGSEAALAKVREAFQIQREELFQAPDGSPVYAHGSFIYLIDSAGAVQTLLPPILAPERIAELIRKYL